MPISAPLRKARRRRRVLSLAFGLLAGFCLSELVAQFGSGWFHHGSRPWYGGILAGMAASVVLTMTRWLVKQLRIQMAAGVSGFLPVMVAIALAVTSLIGAPAPVAAQSAAQCQVIVSGSGKLAGPDSVARSSAGNPIVIDPSDGKSFTLTWNVPPSAADDRDLVMTIWTSIAGVDDVLHRATSDDSNGVYELRPRNADIAPGVYRVWGDLTSNGRVVCPAQPAYIRIAGNPFSSRFGWLMLGGAATGLAGLGLVGRKRIDLWTYTTPDRVSIDIVDPATGNVARGPLTRGAEYVVRVSIEFPDAPAAYAGVPGPVEVAAGVVGAIVGIGTSTVTSGISTIDPRGGSGVAEQMFTVPTTGDSMQLVTDLTVAGNLVQSIRLTEPISVRDQGRISEAVGHVVYRLGGWGAADLLSIRPTDATVMLHGIAGRRAVESWVYSGDAAPGRQLARCTVSLDELAAVIEKYRIGLVEVIRAGVGLSRASDPAGDPALTTAKERAMDEAMHSLASVGHQLRQTLFGQRAVFGQVAPPDGVVLIAHDTEATGSMTIPWTGVYGSTIPDSSGPVCYGQAPSDCENHTGDVVCVRRFWGLAFELAWPNGWIPIAGRSERPGLGWWRRLLAGQRQLAPNILDNRTPVEIVHGVNIEFRDTDPFPDVLPAGATITTRFGRDELLTSLSQWAAEADIVHLFGHGQGTRDFTLSLDADGTNPALDGPALLTAAEGTTLTRGPLVVLNACESGVTPLSGDNSLANAFRTIGARAVIVTESPVLAQEAAAISGQILTDILAGRFVSWAVLEARRVAVAERRNLSALAYRYYGPPGLHLSNPVVDLTVAPARPGRGNQDQPPVDTTTEIADERSIRG